MKSFLYTVLILATAVNVYFMSFSVLNGEINLFNDVA